MAGKKDIEAGRAHVTLMLNDSKFVKGLNAASKHLKSFGTGFAAVGAGITAAGAGILGPLLKMTDMFIDTSSALYDMSQRTGLSVARISELAHAAEQSGTSIESVETGVRKMQKSITDATHGSKSAAKAFADLGLNAKELAKLTPEEQFDAVAKSIAAIEDPTQRAGMAMKVFGKSGTELLPMIEDLDALSEEARRMGFTIEDDAAASAESLGDMLGNLMKTVKFTALNIGSALVPAITAIVKPIQLIATKVLFWVKENKGLVVTIAKVAAGLMAAGTVIAAIGTGIVGLGVVLGGIAATIASVGTIIGAILSPIGLAITGIVALGAALVAGAAYWAMYTESGQNAIAGIMAFLGPLLETFKQTWQGISDAIMSGDLMGAAYVALAGLKVAFLEGIAALSSIVGGVWGDFIGQLGSQIINGDLAGAWDTALTGILASLGSFGEIVVTTFTTIARAVTTAWETLTNLITDSILWLSSKFSGLSKFVLGVDLGAELEKEKKLNAQLGLGPPGGLEAVQNDARSQISGQADAFRNRLDKADVYAVSADQRLPGMVAGGKSAASGALAAAEGELTALNDRMAKARELQALRDEATAAEREDAFSGVPDSSQMKKETLVTFSAAALAAQGQGGMGGLEQTAKESLKEQKRTNRLLEQGGGIA